MQHMNNKTSCTHSTLATLTISNLELQTPKTEKKKSHLLLLQRNLDGALSFFFKFFSFVIPSEYARADHLQLKTIWSNPLLVVTVQL